jgi:hypothetical protein
MLPRTLRGFLKCSILVAAVGVAASLPAVASADYDLALRWNVPTTGVSATTADGVTTFRATAPNAVLSSSDVGTTQLAGNDVVIESGDGTGAVGSITTEWAASFNAPEHDLTFRSNGALSFSGAEFGARDLTLDAGGAIMQELDHTNSYQLSADEHMDITAGGPITLLGNNGLGVLSLHTTSSASVQIHSVDPTALTSSSVAGPLMLLADSGLDLDGTIATGGDTVLVADANAPLASRPGSGDITAEPGTVISAAGHPVQLWSAERDLDDIAPDLTINGSRYTPGPVSITTASEVWGKRWRALEGSPTGPPTVTPFQFVFEAGDLIPPTATLDLPPGVPTYTVGQVVHVQAVCADAGGSGLVSCVKTGLVVGDNIDTTTAGVRIVTVTATDGTGNQAVASRRYVVRAAPLVPPVRPRMPAPRVCVRPTAVTLKLERPKGVRSVVATLSRVRQKVRLTKKQITVTVNVTGRVPGKYPMKVTIRRSHHMKTVTRKPSVIVYKCERR